MMTTCLRQTDLRSRKKQSQRAETESAVSKLSRVTFMVRHVGAFSQAAPFDGNADDHSTDLSLVTGLRPMMTICL